jgi:hypothetical protein
VHVEVASVHVLNEPVHARRVEISPLLESMHLVPLQVCPPKVHATSLLISLASSKPSSEPGTGHANARCPSMQHVFLSFTLLLTWHVGLLQEAFQLALP